MYCKQVFFSSGNCIIKSTSHWI